MRVIYFWKCSEFDVDLKNAHKNSEKGFCFSDKCIWIVCIELSLLRREYLSWVVNVLTESLETFHITTSDFFRLNYLHSHQWIWKKRYRWEWISVLVRLPCSLSMGHLKRDFLDIYLTTFFGVRNFGNS